jgi:hypothetical protein
MSEMISRIDNSLHFHIRWLDKDNLDWECFATREEASERATDLALPGEAFTIEEIHTKCPLQEIFMRNHIADSEGSTRIPQNE